MPGILFPLPSLRNVTFACGYTLLILALIPVVVDYHAILPHPHMPYLGYKHLDWRRKMMKMMMVIIIIIVIFTTMLLFSSIVNSLIYSEVQYTSMILYVAQYRTQNLYSILSQLHLLALSLMRLSALRLPSNFIHAIYLVLIISLHLSRCKKGMCKRLSSCHPPPFLWRLHG